MIFHDDYIIGKGYTISNMLGSGEVQTVTRLM